MAETSEKPLLTFAIAAFNQEAFIREAVEAAFAQTYSPLEIVLSDDCSKDRTFDIMKEMNVPVFFDVTHALQTPGGRADSAGGRRAQITTLARAGMATGLAGLFLEAHPDPEKAKCDGPCALRLSQLEPFLAQLKELDTLVKGFAKLDTH